MVLNSRLHATATASQNSYSSFNNFGIFSWAIAVSRITQERLRPGPIAGYLKQRESRVGRCSSSVPLRHTYSKSSAALCRVAP
jgi:hypothetical protein